MPEGTVMKQSSRTPTAPGIVEFRELAAGHLRTIPHLTGAVSTFGPAGTVLAAVVATMSPGSEARPRQKGVNA
jgi:hypothetical protein